MATSPGQEAGAAPVRHLSWTDAVAVVVGIVIGSGIFSLPKMVAGNSVNETLMILAWVFGGFFCLCGALCYAELSTAYPHSGGEYTYLSRAYGKTIGFLFVWARVAVIQTGSIAFLSYVFGAHAAKVFSIGPSSTMIYAIAGATILTAINIVGVRTGKWTQNTLTAAKVLGIVAIIALAVFFAPSADGQPAAAAESGAPPAAFGLAMVFVLYTFGGWNESAYVAGEVRDAKRNMLRVLIVSIVVLTALYVAINLSYLKILGQAGMSATWTPAADAVARIAGTGGGIAVSVLVAVSALGAMNGTIFTGARAMWALGNDFHVLRPLARWHGRFRTPANALVIQWLVTAILILLPCMGDWLRQKMGSEFETTAEYTMPVFWTFLLLTAVAVFVLRRKDRNVERPFRVPLYPVTVILFALMCGYMLYSSLAYTMWGALAGVGVLIMGVPLYFIFCRKSCNESPATGPA